MDALYKFAAEDSMVWRPFSAAVAQELLVVRGLVHFVEARLDRPMVPRVYCSDASGIGWATHVTAVDTKFARDIAQWRERWRFQPTPDCTPEVEPTDYGGHSSGFQCAPDFDAYIDAEIALCDEDTAGPVVFGSASSKRRVRGFTEQVGLVPALPGELLQPDRWQRVWLWRWRHPRAIHNREARRVLV